MPPLSLEKLKLKKDILKKIQ